ncbi:unnamed protein product [Thlaspi arvense]|uniref:Uncharacterized protein n=1 Tax=Thlaspi arvense TaxID=13288 RepID=A0AAU9T426_THLAR|nr:unnamed protein product [Thlaspi arvense]
MGSSLPLAREALLQPNKDANQAALAIAVSVTRDHRYHSYVASKGPFWLHIITSLEANGDPNGVIH